MTKWTRFCQVSDKIKIKLIVFEFQTVSKLLTCSVIIIIIILL